MRALICGHRDFHNMAVMADVLSDFEITHVIEGEARGADRLARQWAEWRGIPVSQFPADWRHYGRAAGPLRNQQMLEEGFPDVCIAFLHRDSKGTRDMCRRAEAWGVPTHRVHI